MKKETKTYSDQEKTNALLLYERGLLSGTTILEIMGHNASKEKQNKQKEKRGSSCQDANEFYLKQQKLNNESTALVNKERALNIKGNKIEQARRNVEVITKVYNSFADADGKDIQAKMKDVLILNLDILKETKQL